MCTASPTIANYRSSFLPFPTNFPRSAALADILSNALWLAVWGGLDAASYLCYAENRRSIVALELCVSGLPHPHPSWLAVSSASLRGFSSFCAGAFWTWVVKVPDIPDPVTEAGYHETVRSCQQSQWKCSVCLHGSALSLGLSL